jgi:isoleucyl-tRNA synthetase
MSKNESEAKSASKKKPKLAAGKSPAPAPAKAARKSAAKAAAKHPADEPSAGKAGAEKAQPEAPPAAAAPAPVEPLAATKSGRQGAAENGRDWSDTLFLPKTDFPMKAGLPELEPRLLQRWLDIDLYGQLRVAGAGKPKFVLHDGPPYANGNIHIGHALNKILKDLVVKSQTMLGHDSNYVPGWDCHGLPIEWKVE